MNNPSIDDSGGEDKNLGMTIASGVDIRDENASGRHRDVTPDVQVWQ